MAAGFSPKAGRELVARPTKALAAMAIRPRRLGPATESSTGAATSGLRGTSRGSQRRGGVGECLGGELCACAMARVRGWGQWTGGTPARGEPTSRERLERWR